MDEITVGFIKKNFNFITYLDFNIMLKHSKILSNIFDERNKTVCKYCNCSYDSNIPGSYKYEIKNGKRKRVYITNMGCCSRCWDRRGFFNKNIESDFTNENLQKIFELFEFDEEKNGFFDEGKMCCKLPRMLRSNICLNHICDRLKLSQEEHGIVYQSVRILNLIKKENNLPI